MEEDEPLDPKTDTHLTPEARAAEKIAELRMHSELAAIFEGPRKFEADIVAGLDPDVARDVQRAMAKFERAKIESTPVLDATATPDALRVLSLSETAELTTNDYHVYRRPGEVMMVRWLSGEESDTFYNRYQAHCDAALDGLREDERSALEWKSDDKLTADYLAALDAAELNAEQLYFREPVKKHEICVLSTTATDEMNIRFLCEHLMGATIADVIGPNAVPGEDAADGELAWYFKLFSLRGSPGGVERMCFFTFLQKSDDEFDF